MKKYNKKKFLTLEVLLITSLFLLSMLAIFDVTADNNTNDYNIVITKSDISGVELDLHINDYTLETIEAEGTNFDRLQVWNGGKTADYGKAELPIVSFYVAVPQGAEINLDYEVSNIVNLNNFYVYPSQPPLPETEGYIDPPFTINESFYLVDEYYPSSVVEVSPIMIMRGCQLVRISVFPFSFNPVIEKLKLTKDININIEFVGGNGEFISERYRSVYFQPIFDAFLVNNNCLEQVTLNNPSGGTGNSGRSDRADLLIVVYDDFYEEILPLAEWRHSTGLETKVVKWSEIGTTAEDLRNYMNNAYHNWELPPSFLLIVGDADHVPVNYLYTHPYHYTSTGTDHWYVALDGADYLPEIHTGRISVEDENQLTVVVNKILDYSKHHIWT